MRERIRPAAVPVPACRRTIGLRAALVCLVCLRPALVCLVCVLAAGCKVPPFHEDVAQAARLTGQMRLEGRVGPIDVGGGVDLLEELRFVPVSTDFESGFLLRDGSRLQIGFVEEHGDLVNVSVDPAILEFDNSGGQDLAYRARTVAETGPYLALANVNPTSPAPQWRLSVMEYDHQLAFADPNGSTDVIFDGSVGLDFVVGAAFIDTVVGCSMGPGTDPSRSRIAYLCRESAIPTDYYQVTYDLVSYDPGLESPLVVHSGPVVLADAPLNVRYYYDPDQGAGGSGVGQYRKDGSWTTCMWDDTTRLAPVPLEITERIDALLTSGRLLCRDDDAAYLYDLNGNLINRFRMGDLRFAHEVWDSAAGEHRAVFVHGYFAGYSGESGLYFEVYSVETGDLDEID